MEFGFIVIILITIVILLVLQQDTRIDEMPQTKQVLEWAKLQPNPGIIYRDYINSSLWFNSKVRAEVLLRDKHQCTMCNSKQQIEVHHTHYNTLGKECAADLVTLCHECHTYTHLIAGKGAGAYPAIKKGS